ncbi:hypothetical protein K466DRAFT_607069 [Polyporus arcularius HHB13444]|uniref:Uncharacterized protein n=1 Tax=Polyporus arcularius HHB13444 TaxID=1314778 RepID=A0A5C3NPS5_9APHY|nr:hypothetical protein K466DRAFT_607069 [Polyporus arcularius HHB13444]
MPKRRSKPPPRRRYGPVKQAEWKCGKCTRKLKIQVCNDPTKDNYGRLFVVCSPKDKHGKPEHPQYFRFCHDLLSDSDSDHSESEASASCNLVVSTANGPQAGPSAGSSPTILEASTSGSTAASQAVAPARCVFGTCTGRCAKRCPHAMCRAHCSVVGGCDLHESISDTVFALAIEARCELRLLTEQLSAVSGASASSTSRSTPQAAAIRKTTANSFRSHSGLSPSPSDSAIARVTQPSQPAAGPSQVKSQLQVVAGPSSAATTYKPERSPFTQLADAFEYDIWPYPGKRRRTLDMLGEQASSQKKRLRVAASAKAECVVDPNHAVCEACYISDTDPEEEALLDAKAKAIQSHMRSLGGPTPSPPWSPVLPPAPSPPWSPVLRPEDLCPPLTEASNVAGSSSSSSSSTLIDLTLDSDDDLDTFPHPASPASLPKPLIKLEDVEGKPMPKLEHVDGSLFVRKPRIKVEYVDIDLTLDDD